MPGVRGALTKIPTSGGSDQKWAQHFLMTDEEFIDCFEADRMPGEFHHAEHVRLAFAYLSRFPVLQALDRFASALKRFATARGKTELYHAISLTGLALHNAVNISSSICTLLTGLRCRIK